MSTSSFNRPGAIDLSQLAAKAKQQSSGGAAGSYVLEVTESTFDTEVIRRSLKHPVVLELYSPRVATGQQLSDALAALASEGAGKFFVARVNVDTAPQIVQALQLQAVPTVIGVVGGQLAPLFQGVLGKKEAGAYIDELLKAAVATGVVGRAEPVAGAPGAEAEEDDVPDPRFAAADEALDRGDFDGAVAEFDKLLQANPADVEAKAGKAQARLLARTAGLDPTAVLAAAGPTAPLEDHFTAADIEVVLGRPEAAFARLIELIKATSGAERDQVRGRLLELFDTLGNADPRVLKARRDLMTALF